MAISVRVVGARVGERGQVLVRFSDKTELEFASAEKLRTLLQRFDRDDIKEFLRMLALAKYVRSDPTLSNPAAIAGRTVTLDLSLASNLVRIT